MTQQNKVITHVQLILTAVCKVVNKTLTVAKDLKKLLYNLKKKKILFFLIQNLKYSKIKSNLALIIFRTLNTSLFMSCLLPADIVFNQIKIKIYIYNSALALTHQVITEVTSN